MTDFILPGLMLLCAIVTEVLRHRDQQRVSYQLTNTRMLHAELQGRLISLEQRLGPNAPGGYGSPYE